MCYYADENVGTIFTLNIQAVMSEHKQCRPRSVLKDSSF